MVRKKIAFSIISSCLVVYTLYYNDLHRFHYKFIRPRRELNNIYNDTDDFLINTPGCYIPNFQKRLVFENPTRFNGSTCGKRAIFIKRVGNDKIALNINDKIMKNYTKKQYFCCYAFSKRSSISGKEDTQLSRTKCKNFKSGQIILLSEEVITVACKLKKKQKKITRTIVYEDSYILLKKIKLKLDKYDTTKVNKETTKLDKRWNVLLLGMDTMSRARLLHSMPNTVKYFRKHGWLDYRGYQKVGFNTYPNLMAVLTGKKLSTLYKACDTGMYKCNDHFIWSKFRKTGYITAYGEDNLSLPDTFFNYKGFQTIPTHHYMRPFYLTGEQRIGNVICAHHKPSAKHMLDYAVEFVNTYKSENFFGIFWINSYSHNLNNIPALLDDDIVNFFEQVNQTDIMDNTFVILLSDHGLRYGETRKSVHSYYEERLPMFFVWIPHEFRKLHSDKFYTLQVNQGRLVTPYDLYLTLAEIASVSKNPTDLSEACPKCTSLFQKKSLYRTCHDSGVSSKWCSCHGMAKVNRNESEATSSVVLAVSHIQEKIKSIETIDCTACIYLQLDFVIRIHSFKDSRNNTNYVVAFQMTPGAVSFEATIVHDGNALNAILPIETISTYNTRGNCVKNPNDRPYCVCKLAKCSHK